MDKLVVEVGFLILLVLALGLIGGFLVAALCDWFWPI